MLQTHQGNNYTYGTNSENDQKTGKTDPPQSVIERRHIKKSRGGGTVENQTHNVTCHKWEEQHKHRGAKGSDSILETPEPRDLHCKDKFHNTWPCKQWNLTLGQQKGCKEEPPNSTKSQQAK